MSSAEQARALQGASRASATKTEVSHLSGCRRHLQGPRRAAPQESTLHTPVYQAGFVDFVL